MPFKIVRNDITRVKADVIVNTANPNPICASGTDLAIYEAAGKEKLLASVLFAVIRIGKRGIGFPVNWKKVRPAKKETSLILKYGLPIAAQEALTGVSFMV